MFNYTHLNPDKCDYFAVAEVHDLANGERMFIELGDEYLVIFNIGGDFYAIADLCSHDGGPLGDGEVDDHAVICPRHGARFDLHNGEALTFPAVEDIAAYPIRVQDDMIEVGIPKS
jgi:3-phenylpropionate/trans-cinnamate dioxygenase ferredoxin subunit